MECTVLQSSPCHWAQREVWPFEASDRLSGCFVIHFCFSVCDWCAMEQHSSPSNQEGSGAFFRPWPGKCTSAPAHCRCSIPTLTCSGRGRGDFLFWMAGNPWECFLYSWWQSVKERVCKRDRENQVLLLCPPLLLAPSCLGEASKHGLKLTKAHTHKLGYSCQMSLSPADFPWFAGVAVLLCAGRLECWIIRVEVSGRNTSTVHARGAAQTIKISLCLFPSLPFTFLHSL